MNYSEYKQNGDIVTSVAANTLMMTTVTPDTDPQSKVITVGNLAGSLNRIGANAIPLMSGLTPANSTITSTGGTFWYDSNYLYIAVANNVVKRVALSSF